MMTKTTCRISRRIPLRIDSDAAIPYLPKGMYIDTVTYDGGFGKGAAEGGLFYRRK